VEASALPHPIGLGRLAVAGPLLRLRSDEQLVALFRAGHDEAFGTIHDRYRQRLFAYARQMLGGSRPDAEDVLQDVFLRAYDALRVDGRPVLLRAWLYRVAHNRCIDQLRRPMPLPEDVYDLNRGPSQDPTAEAERREDMRRLVADVRRLPEQQRSALLMREMEGLSYAELADALVVTIPAVKSLLVRARIGLVEAIEARDTACGEIRADLVVAFDRGVRASGRSRKHLRECAGCREYRGALRGIEKQLNGLAPSSGPLTTLAKILGIGGAGSGAAAGTGAVGGGGGAAVVGTGAATIGTGAAAATATKVAAVLATAAVVGGSGAAIEQAGHHRESARAAQATTARHAAPSVSAPPTQRRTAFVVHASGVPRPLTVHGALKAPRSVAHVERAGAPVAASAGTAAPAYEATTGGLEAPEEAVTAPGDTGTGATTGTGPATPAGTTGSGTTTTPAAPAPGATETASAAPGSGAAPTSGGSGGTPAAGTTAAAQATAPAPVAQNASAPPAG
jgi:RNA polymerase sigma factor (sigma-70 family)